MGKSAFTAPSEMQVCQSAFLRFYESVHQGRRLAWMHHLGKADVRLNYLRKKYLVKEFFVLFFFFFLLNFYFLLAKVSAGDFQCALLLLFNRRELAQSASWEECAAETALSEGELEKTLASLVASKLLLRGKAEKDGPGATYTVNTGYSNKVIYSERKEKKNCFVFSLCFFFLVCKHLKFKITAALQGESEKDKKKTYKQVDDDRTLFLQALIVRIMKTRRQMNHNALMQEVRSVDDEVVFHWFDDVVKGD